MECFYIVTVGWIFSVCLHEFAHAWVAYRGGDHTVKEKGYLTFNPLKYTDPVFSIILPIVFLILGGIGLPGGAVYINHSLLRSRTWETAVALAGPAINLVVAVIIGALFKFGVVQPDPDNLAAVSLAFLLHLEISAIILNLIPIPPLDGFQAVAPWLPERVRQAGYANSNVGMLVLFIALWYVPGINNLFWDTVLTIDSWFGIGHDLIRVGWRTYRFWD